MLQEQVVKSEEKYRSVFTTTPTRFSSSAANLPDPRRQQTAENCYGYSKAEMAKLPFFVLEDDGDEEVKNGCSGWKRASSCCFPKGATTKKAAGPFSSPQCEPRRIRRRDVLIATTRHYGDHRERGQLIQAGKMTTLGVMGRDGPRNQPALNVIQVSADYILKMLRRGQPPEDVELTRVARTSSPASSVPRQ